MHSLLDRTSLPRVEESIKGVQQTASDSGSSSHSVLTRWLLASYTKIKTRSKCRQNHSFWHNFLIYKKKYVMKLRRDLYLSNLKKPFHSGLGSRQLMPKFVPLQQKPSAFSTCLIWAFLNKGSFPSQARGAQCHLARLAVTHRSTEWKRLK